MELKPIVQLRKIHKIIHQVITNLVRTYNLQIVI